MLFYVYQIYFHSVYIDLETTRVYKWICNILRFNTKANNIALTIEIMTDIKFE